MTLDEILARVELSDEQRIGLRTLLLVREDAMRDAAMMAGAQFGMLPGIVAEIVATIGLGTPPSVEERQLIRQNFLAAVEQIRRMIQGDQP